METHHVVLELHIGGGLEDRFIGVLFKGSRFTRAIPSKRKVLWGIVEIAVRTERIFKLCKFFPLIRI